MLITIFSLRFFRNANIVINVRISKLKILLPLAPDMWFTLTIILLSALCIILIRPSLFETDKETIKPAKPTNKWDGPKTDPRINKMLAESITLLKNLNVPISNSICPTVKLIGSRRTLGRCCAKGSRKKYTEYDYYIEISGHTLNNPEKSLQNTLIHELLHTVPHGMCHTGEWKKWAKYVSQKTGHTIQRLAENKNE